MTMAVFYKTGDGDIYGGPDKESVIAAMREDAGKDFDVNLIEEVPEDTKVGEIDENEEPTGTTISIADEYQASMGSYCVATANF